MLPADPPPVVATATADKPADPVVISRDTRSDVLINTDTPLFLVKGRRREDAVLRQTLFMRNSLTVVRPAASVGEQVLRWTFEPYLQRQLCFTSITGLFSCAAAEIDQLDGKAEGEAALAATPEQVTPDPNPTAEAARIAVAADLRTRAAALFEDDRRLKLSPMLKTAGVSIRRSPVHRLSAPKTGP